MIEFNIEIKNKVVNSAVKAEIATIEEARIAIESLEKIGNKMSATTELIKSHLRCIEQAYGRLLGMLKADNDTRPIHAREVINGIPLDNFVKLLVDEHVRTKVPNIKTVKGRFELEPTEESVTKFFGVTKDFVIGFAYGYAFAISEIAKKKHKKLKQVNKFYDICKNSSYFFESNISNYRIDGNYPVYKIGYFGILSKVGVKELNKGIYEKLQKAY